MLISHNRVMYLIHNELPVQYLLRHSISSRSTTLKIDKIDALVLSTYLHIMKFNAHSLALQYICTKDIHSVQKTLGVRALPLYMHQARPIRCGQVAMVNQI